MELFVQYFALFFALAITLFGYYQVRKLSKNDF